MRLDKFLWCVRLCKTRSLATEACRKGRALLNEQEVRPSMEVGAGDTIAVRRPPIWRRFRILDVPASRVGAKLVPKLLEDITPFADLEKAEIARKVHARPDGLPGRPTKRQRRDIDRFRDDA
ncbi:MAG: RNA-binding S4 domain-containing protein [Flavobacteriales bacterium]|nr:RNA-binding S4 domain-containing protein [Flavobacteriales bacterium]MCB9166415.1 RNA-binding S4 domain-containing protein [Flavobacteriales bacterium]